MTRHNNDYTAERTRNDAERAIARALDEFERRMPSGHQLQDVLDAIEALLRRNYAIAWVLAIGVLDERRGGGQPAAQPQRSVDDARRSFAAVKAELDRHEARRGD
jgi:hypothetical protein